MAILYGLVTNSNPDWLLSSPENAEAIAVPVEPGNGVIERGTVLYRKASGMYAPASASECTVTNALVVLNTTVDSSANATIAEDVDAYRAGRFVYGRVKLAAGAAVTAAVAQVLRLQNIVFDQAENAAEFNNVKG